MTKHILVASTFVLLLYGLPDQPGWSSFGIDRRLDFASDSKRFDAMRQMGLPECRRHLCGLKNVISLYFAFEIICIIISMTANNFPIHSRSSLR